MKIDIKKIGNGKLPEYKTEGSVGADCYARIDKIVEVLPGTVETIPLGFAVSIPRGYEMQIRGRSGNARKDWVQVFNSPGTIDCDYRGEVGAILYNASKKTFVVRPNDRIAQAIIAPVSVAQWNEVDELDETIRGENGFGSTGRNDVEKYYEPFRDYDLAEKEIGKEVIIDNGIQGNFNSLEIQGNRILFNFTVMNHPGNWLMSPLEAFQRVKINGHRFGQELSYEDY